MKYKLCLDQIIDRDESAHSLTLNEKNIRFEICMECYEIIVKHILDNDNMFIIQKANLILNYLLF